MKNEHWSHSNSRHANVTTITLLTGGTRGDILPYLALGNGLRAEGFNVRIAAPRGFEQLIEQFGLNYAGFEGNPSDLMINQGDPLTIGNSLLRSIRATNAFFRKARAIYPYMLKTAAEACRGSDAILYGLPTLWGTHIADCLDVPEVRALLQPITPTRDFSPALLPFRANLGGIGNWLTHWLLLQGIWVTFRREIGQVRRTQFGLPPAGWLDPSLRPLPLQPATLYGFSRHIIPRPSDWNEKQIITGYWTDRKGPYISDEQANRIRGFVDRSPENTIAVGLGSPGTREILPFIELLERALERCGAQAVFTVPNDWHARAASARILPIEYAPHDWLYRRVRAAVHHGGAGTTSAGLHAGIPSVIVPLAIDQFYWGERIHAIGAGTRPLPQRSLSIDKLAAAIRQAITDTSMRTRAKSISKVLATEDGVQTAVRVIQKIL